MKIVNKSDYTVKQLMRLARIVRKRMRRSFIMPDEFTITVESYDSSRWEGHFEGNEIKVRLGRFVTFPASWDNKVLMPTWEDLFVAMLTWCMMLYVQKTAWAKKGLSERKRKYYRVDCQEITVRMINQWRVDSEMKMIFEKAGMRAD